MLPGQALDSPRGACAPQEVAYSRLSASHLVAAGKKAIDPRPDLRNRLTSSRAIQLFVEDVVIAELDPPAARERVRR